MQAAINPPYRAENVELPYLWLRNDGGTEPDRGHSVSFSLVAGEFVGLSVSAVNSDNANVSTTFTFNSSNTQIATISPAGNVCAGVWDSAFVVCNGSDAQGNPISGTAIITATAGGITSGPVTVAVHPSITSVTIDPVTQPCFSIA